MEQITVVITYARGTGRWEAVARHWPGTGTGRDRALHSTWGVLPGAADPEELLHHALGELHSEAAQVTVPMGTRDPWEGAV